MTAYIFDRYESRGFKRGRCVVCGKGAERSVVFDMTDNPWNKNPDGTRRSVADIRLALAEKVTAWEGEPVTHAKCEVPRG